ncbi:MAG TPA: Sir2 family NAD-dependent protein deacetylase, partial [Anaerolineales bacterium]|nr:Sir2 family NAD-dependent protein deacetylase [Anaerolineales bacterium]
EVASLSSFRYTPQKFFSWMRSLVEVIVQAQPNAAHYAVAALEEQGYVQSIITQNIDGLHQRAGADDVLEVHGSLASLTCVSCYEQYPGENFIDSYLAFGEIPYCPACGHILKPNLILFGEQLPAKVFLRAQDISKRCDLMIVAGSSLEVLPVAGLPMRAVESGAHLILINKSKTYLDVRADVVLHEDVVDVLPAIVQAVNQKKR